MKKKLLLLLTILSFIYSIDSLFLDFHFDYKVPVRSPFEAESQEPEAPIPYQMRIDGGLLSSYYKVRNALEEIEEVDIPTDAYPEKTIDKIQRAVISKQISITIQVFLLLLSINSFVGIFYNTWFSVFSGRSLFLLSTFLSLFYAGRCSFHMQFVPIPAFLAFLYNLFCFFFFIWGFRYLNIFFEDYEPTYNSLYIASMQDEESNTGKIELYYKKKRKPAFQSKLLNFFFDNLFARGIKFLFTNRIIRHFVYIIFAGIFIGNMIYIPLFSLQKHYASEFGILIFSGIFFLTLFYIRNYYKIGKEEAAGYFKNISISFAFLQYRFLRNLTMFLLMTVGIIIFVTTLFLLLTLNSSILVDQNIIDKTINL